MSRPQSFPPLNRDVTVVPLEAYNEVVHDLEKARAELIRARQKIAHLLKEKKDD